MKDKQLTVGELADFLKDKPRDEVVSVDYDGGYAYDYARGVYRDDEGVHVSTEPVKEDK